MVNKNARYMYVYTLYILVHLHTCTCVIFNCPFSQVYVNNSGKQKGLSQPFGYLKASTNLTHVTLFVMPYNFPTLLPLIGKNNTVLCMCVRE